MKKGQISRHHVVVQRDVQARRVLCPASLRSTQTAADCRQLRDKSVRDQAVARNGDVPRDHAPFAGDVFGVTQ